MQDEGLSRCTIVENGVQMPISAARLECHGCVGRTLDTVGMICECFLLMWV